MKFCPCAAAINLGASTTSWTFPAVMWTWMGLPRPSTSAWIFVVKPPRERPMHCFSAPLFRQLNAGARGRRWRRPCWIPGPRRRSTPSATSRKCRAHSSARSGCERSSKDQIAPANPAKELPSTRCTPSRQRTYDSRVLTAVRCDHVQVAAGARSGTIQCR